MYSLIYVSRSSIAPADRARVLDDIMAVSIARNSALDITGLLITTGDYFAQLLEGPPPNIDTVMTSIIADPRHQAVRIICSSTIAQPQCGRWHMARFDDNHFGNASVSRMCADVLAQSDPGAVRRLRRLVEAFAQTRTPASHRACTSSR